MSVRARLTLLYSALFALSFLSSEQAAEGPRIAK